MKKLIFSAVLLFATALGMAAAGKASYPGGEEALHKYITETMKYPAESKANGIEGNVEVSFVVRTDGSIGPIRIVRMIDPDLEAEAIRLVKAMPKWVPAEDNSGNAVESTVSLSIPFSISE